MRPQFFGAPAPDDAARARARVSGLGRPVDASGPEDERTEPSSPGWVPEESWWQAPAKRSRRWSAVTASLVDRLPPALRGATIAPSRPALAGLSVVALVVVVLTGWLLLRGTPRPAAVDTRLPPRTVPAGAPSPSPVKVVLVDVAGKVRRPGVVRLPFGSRVADALRAAGGVPPGVDIGLLNLARPLADGEQVVVGLGAVGLPAPAAGGTGSPGAGPVDLNAATVADLDGLPGVGPVLAQRIVDWRQAHGPFTSVGQLREVSGIGDRKFADLEPLVRV